jgi:glutathionyl-hydroquinone reductase
MAGPQGWRFPTPEDKDAEGEQVIPDPIEGHEDFTHIRQVYYETEPNYKGRFTVPVLYDKVQKCIVNNESSEILRMLSSDVRRPSGRHPNDPSASCGTESRAYLSNGSQGERKVTNNYQLQFDDLIDEKYRAVQLYPEALRSEIDETHGWQYDQINNGVYKSGFATTQSAYERNVLTLFEALDRAEEHLSKTEGPYWFGKQLTEVDVRL